MDNAGSSPVTRSGVQRSVAGVEWTVVSSKTLKGVAETGDYAAKSPHLGEWGLPFYPDVAL